MRTPKFTDTARYPNGYVRANETDITQTFERVRLKLAEERASKKVVTPISRRTK